MFFDNTIANISSALQLGALGEEQAGFKILAENVAQKFLYRLETGKFLQDRERNGEGKIQDFRS